MENKKCFLCETTEYDAQELQEFMDGKRRNIKGTRMIIITSPYTKNQFCLCEKCAKWITKNIINLL